MRYLRRALLTGLAFVLLGCDIATSPDPWTSLDVETIEYYWAVGIKQLEECGVKTELKWDDFVWKETNSVIDCAGTLTGGCYRDGLIEYWVDQPDAIRHEAGHAVLHRMGYEDWRLWQHDPEVACEGVR